MPNIKGDQLNVGTGPNQIVQLDNSSRLPAVDGSQLIGISGGGGSPVVTNPLTKDLDTNGFSIVTAGVGSPTNATANPITIQGGRNDYTGGGQYGGTINITGGYGANGNYGGFLNLFAGESNYGGGSTYIRAGNGVSGFGGSIYGYAGNGATSGGSISFYSGSATGTGPGGDFTIKSGNGTGSFSGGTFNAYGGQAVSGTAGNARLRGGVSTTGQSGYAAIIGGNTTSGQGGAVRILAGNASTGGTGGEIEIRAGNSAGAGLPGGDVRIRPGNGSGAVGTINLETGASVGGASLRFWYNTDAAHNFGNFVELKAPTLAAGSPAEAILFTLPGAQQAQGQVLGIDLGEFTVAGLPTASTYPNCWALATNASGGRTIVRSDGTNWKVVITEGATVTT